MNNISTYCPSCRFSLEIPPDFQNVICRGCATAYLVRRHGDALSLFEITPKEEDSLLRATEAGPVIDRRLADIDELMEEVELEIAALRSREQSAPLQLGCAFFGLFMTIIVVSALFMLLGKSYFGSWMFYASIAAVILLGFARIRRKLVGTLQREKLRQDRLLIEDSLAQLEAERDRILKLKAFLDSEEVNQEGQAD
jgi:hypothetical protein